MMGKLTNLFAFAALLLFGACTANRQIAREVVSPVTIAPVQPRAMDPFHYPPPRLSAELPLLTLPQTQAMPICYQMAYEELEAMLQGRKTPDFERAVFISENAYYDNQYTYKNFRESIDFHLDFVQYLVAANDKSDSMDFNVRVNASGRFNLDDIRHPPAEKKELYRKALANWAIFKYITDTTIVYPFCHLPFVYATQDPFGIKDWSNSQVMHLLHSREQEGNCFALTALYKILADRIHADARLCTAPQHIYIQHRDDKGDYYNVELATAGHPGDGTIQTLTYTTTDAIMSGIALRSYDVKQSIGLCLVNLAKSYGHQFQTRDDEFILKCAALALKHDSLNLNALLLKQQVLDARVTGYAIKHHLDHVYQLKADAKISKTVMALEKHLALLYRLGYRQMPVDMQEIIMTGIYPGNFEDKNPSPFTSIDPKDPHRKTFQALYGGLFREVFETRPQEPYGHFTLKTQTSKITAMDTAAQAGFLIDPVAFAYDFGARIYDARLGRWLSTDPLSEKQPGWPPYKSFLDNPVIFADPDGRQEFLTVKTILRDGTILEVRKEVKNRNMTDGRIHKYKQIATESFENYYYNFETVKVRVEQADGSFKETVSNRIRYEDAVKGKEGVYFGGDLYGETQIDAFSQSGGFYITTEDVNKGISTTKYISANEAKQIDLDLVMKAVTMGNLQDIKNIYDAAKNLADGVDYAGAAGLEAAARNASYKINQPLEKKTTKNFYMPYSAPSTRHSGTDGKNQDTVIDNDKEQEFRKANPTATEKEE